MPLSQLGNARKNCRKTDLCWFIAGGYSSSIAASLLQQRGFRAVREIAGGVTAWDSAKLPVKSGT